jgi:NitT/TauT family transport system substrate-binding protein
MPQKQTIRIGHLRITDHLALGVTADKLERKEEELQHATLEIRAYAGWNPLAGDLRGGEIDAACILAPIAMELYNSKKNTQLVLQMHKVGSVIVTNKRANIQKLEDFKGRAVLIPHYLSVHHLLFDKVLRDGGLEIGPGKDVICDVAAPAEIPEIMEWDEKGKVGGFIVAEPFGSQVIKAGYGTEFALSKDIWPNHPCCVLVVKSEFVAKYPEAVQELVSSLVKSGSFIENNRAKAAEIGAKFLKQDAAVMQRVLTEPADRVTFGEMRPVLRDYDFIQAYLTTKIHAMSSRIELEKFVDLRFADQAGAR